MGGNSLRALRRRWYLVLVGLVATAALGWTAWSSTPPTYQAEGSVLFLPSESTVSGDGVRNPFLELSNLDVPASVVAARVGGNETRERINATAPNADYTIDLDPTVRGPVLLITATDATRSGALGVLQELLDSVPHTLQALQDELKVPSEAELRSMQLTVDSHATKITKATIRALVAATAVGLALTVAVSIGFDVLLQRRSQRRAAESAEQESTESPESPESPESSEPSDPSASRWRRHRQDDWSDDDPADEAARGAKPDHLISVR